MNDVCDHATVAYESADTPWRSGAFTVTEHCACGAVIGTYEDSVL